MKKIIIIIYILFIIIFSSCDEWLYLEPENGIIRERFWKSKEDAFSALMGCYAGMLGNNQGSGYSIPQLMFIWGEIRADMVMPFRLRTDFNYVYYGDILPDNGITQWNQFYKVINYCNTLLEFGKIAQANDPSFKLELLHQYEGEALAIRALMYYYLVRTFDEVPLILKATVSDAADFKPHKSSRTVILNQIKKDLEIAEKYLPYVYPTIPETKSRFTKYAVNALQADIYLWCNQYDSCIIACDKIINSGSYGLVPNDDYWFTNLYVNGNSIESIFELPFSKEILNPYYDFFKASKYFMASPNAMEYFFPFDESVSPDSTDIRGDGCSYNSKDFYTIWKYIAINKNTLRNSNESYAHFIVYRLAEIFLFKAEALLNLGQYEEALKYIDLIRKRGRASNLTKIESNTTDLKILTNYLLDERAREFAFEGKRWFDILRNAKRNNYARKDLFKEMVFRNSPAEKQQTIINKYQDTLYHYLPIYYKELESNENLKQNPFYSENK